MTKVIGILGGISPASTAAYYRRIVSRYHERRGDYHFPEIVLYSLDFQRFTELEHANQPDAYVAEIVRGIQALERAGADFAIMAANSPHAVFDPVSRQARIPLLSIVESTGHEAVRRGLKNLLLLGIKFTMQSSFYAQALARHGIKVSVPALDHQTEIDALIFDELVKNIVTDWARRRLVEIMGCYDPDGVILGCTELPLLLQTQDTSIPLLDTLALHADAALDYAMADESTGARAIPQTGGANS